MEQTLFTNTDWGESGGWLSLCIPSVTLVFLLMLPIMIFAPHRLPTDFRNKLWFYLPASIAMLLGGMLFTVEQVAAPWRQADEKVALMVDKKTDVGRRLTRYEIVFPVDDTYVVPKSVWNQMNVGECFRLKYKKGRTYVHLLPVDRLSFDACK
jgi:branched-subunit amino acid transport protein AzlD